jgi:hypothetical protein
MGIREFIRVLLREAREYGADEIIDYDDIDLGLEYRKLNDLLFGGELDVPKLRWGRRKTAHGHVSATKYGLTGKIRINELVMSMFNSVTYKQFRDTLAHEMIHVYWLMRGVDDGHGPRFISKMNEINAKGFNVSIKAEGDFEVSSKIRGRRMVFVILDIRGERRIIVMSEGVYEKHGMALMKSLQYFINLGFIKPGSYNFYVSSDPQLLKFGENRNFKSSVSHTSIGVDLENRLIGGAERISVLDVTRGGYKWEGKVPIGVEGYSGEKFVFGLYYYNWDDKIIVMTEAMYMNEGSELATEYEFIVNSGSQSDLVIDFYESSNPLLGKFTKGKDFKKVVKGYLIEPKDLDKIMSDAVNISTLRLVKGENYKWEGKVPRGV